jgi:hypothetical protein
MRYALPLALAIGCVIGILLALAPIVSVEADKRAQLASIEIAEAEWRLAEEQRQSLVTQDARDMAAQVWIAAGPGIVLLAFVGAVLGLLVLADKHMLSRDSEQVAENGTIRILRSQRAQVGPAALAAFWWARILGATPAQRQLPESRKPMPDSPMLEAPGLPPVTELGQLMARGFVPSPDRVLLGLLPGGKQITAPIGNDLCHIVFAGRTGVGKSNLARLILTQVLASGAEVFLLDPHYAPVDPETGDDWQLIAAATVPGRAITTDAEIMRTLQQAGEEIEARLKRRAEGKPIGKPRFYMIDEAPRLSDDREFMKLVAKIVREARKFKIYAILASQDMLTATLQTTGGVRANFATCYCGGGDRTTINALLGQYPVKGQSWPEPPGRGVVYLKSDVLPQVEMVRVPLVTNADVTRLLSRPVSRTISAWRLPETVDVVPRNGSETAAKRVETAETEKERRVREMVARRASQGEIIKEVWDATPGGGAAYQKASVEYREIMAKIAGG